MNILIIGGAGYIGSHVAQEFLDQGCAITVFDNLSSGLRENLFEEAAFVHGDILDYTALLRAVRRGQGPSPQGREGAPFDGLIHLAAFKAAGESMTEPEKYAVNNITGTINILNAAVEGGIRALVFSSSAAVYGEPQYLPVDEDHPARPQSFYGFTKREIERLLGWYDQLRGLRFASLRYFNAAGYDAQGRICGLETQPANLIPVIMETACGLRREVGVFGDDYPTPDGTGVRDYIHVSDLARAHARALDYIRREDRSVTVNLGSGVGFSVLEVLEAARRISGRPIAARMLPRRAGDPARLTASAGLARTLFGWSPQESDLETLIGTSWEAYRKKLR